MLPDVSALAAETCPDALTAKTRKRTPMPAGAVNPQLSGPGMRRKKTGWSSAEIVPGTVGDGPLSPRQALTL